MRPTLVLLLLAALSSLGAAAAAGGRQEAAPDPDALHAPFTTLLAAHVRDGRVDYAALKESPEALDGYLRALAAVDPAGLPREARMAFWINAYNAFTLRLIVDHYPTITSIKDIPRGDRWLARRWVVNGERHSLDQIEHRILRPMGDARIHAALNCASRGCPDLLPAAYLASTLDAQLDSAMRRFLADPDKGLAFGTEPGLLWGTDHVLRLSPLFDWFDDDFERSAGSVLGFVRRYAPGAAVAFMNAHDGELELGWLDYDWSLNGS